MPSCCVPYCTSNTVNRKDLSFHEFPSDLNLHSLWLKNISRKNFQWNDASGSDVVCSIHFKEDDYISGLKRRKLKKGTVPSIFPGYPNYMQPKTLKKRRLLERNYCGSTTLNIEKVQTLNFGSTQLQPSDSTTLRIVKVETLNLGRPKILKDNVRSMSPGSPGHTQPKSPNNSILECQPNAFTMPIKVSDQIASKNIPQLAEDEIPEEYLEIKKLKTTIHNLQSKIYRQNKKLQKQQEQVNSLKATVLDFQKKHYLKLGEVLKDAIKPDGQDALFLLDLFKNYRANRPSWSKETVGLCNSWNSSSTEGYNFPRKNGFLNLPGKSTLIRRVVKATGETEELKVDSNADNLNNI